MENRTNKVVNNMEIGPLVRVDIIVDMKKIELLIYLYHN